MHPVLKRQINDFQKSFENERKRMDPVIIEIYESEKKLRKREKLFI